MNPRTPPPQCSDRSTDQVEASLGLSGEPDGLAIPLHVSDAADLPELLPEPAARRRTRGLISAISWPRLAWYQEVLAVIAVDIIYEVVRALAPKHATEAFHNAALVTAIEPGPVRSFEFWLRRLTSADPVLSWLFNGYYAVFHLTVTIGVLVWLWRRPPEQYARARTALFALTLAALAVFWIFPVAPPRLVTPQAISALGTPAMAALHGNASGTYGLPENPYAAFPSLHVAWATWCAWAIWTNVRSRLRWAAWLYPVATTLVVVGTANHYIIDVVAGLLLTLLAVAG